VKSVIRVTGLFAVQHVPAGSQAEPGRGSAEALEQWTVSGIEYHCFDRGCAVRSGAGVEPGWRTHWSWRNLGAQQWQGYSRPSALMGERRGFRAPGEVAVFLLVGAWAQSFWLGLILPAGTLKSNSPRHLSSHDTQSKVTIVGKKSLPGPGPLVESIDPPASELVSMDANVNDDNANVFDNVPSLQPFDWTTSV
jgi:hypothetical protein